MDPAPKVYVLESQTPISDVRFSDLSGNGRPDALVLAAGIGAEMPRKSLLVFAADVDGGYSPGPAQVLELPATAGAVFLTETSGGPPSEIAVADQDGITVYAFTEDAFQVRNQVDHTSLLPVGGGPPRFVDGLSYDLTGDGKDEWVLPDPAGYQVRQGGTVLSHLEAPLVVQTAAHGKVSYHFATVRPFPQASGQPLGLAMLVAGTAFFFEGAGWERKTAVPLPYHDDSTFSRPPLFETPRPQHAATFPQMPRAAAHACMEDINGNGLPDLLLFQTGGTMGATSRCAIYFARAPAKYAAAADVVFERSGAFTQPTLVDVDGDDALDLLFIEVPFGARFFANLLLRQRISLRAEAFIQAGGRIPARSTVTSTYALAPPEQEGEGVYALGDFNGDGRTDFAFGTGNNSVSVHLGGARALINNRPWITLAMPVTGETRTYQCATSGRAGFAVFNSPDSGLTRLHVAVF